MHEYQPVVNISSDKNPKNPIKAKIISNDPNAFSLLF